MKNKKIWIWAIIGFIYAFIPMSVMAFGKSSGEVGPGIILILPPFWPVAFSFFGIIGVFAFFAKFSTTLLNFGSSPLMNYILIILTLIFWTILGGLIGYISTRKEKIKNK